jgi:hypothetical protein
MLRLIRLLPVALLLAVLAPTVSIADGAPTPSANDYYVTEKGFKSAVLQVKHRDAEEMANVLNLLGSGFKGAMVRANSALGTITVRDFPENIATMEDALKRLDVASAPSADIELRIYVLLASGAASTTAQPVPAELREVIAQLQKTLQYKNYELAATIEQRVTATKRGPSGSGTAQIPQTGSTAQATLAYNYGFDAIGLSRNETGVRTISIGKFNFDTISDGGLRTNVSTALNLREGERVVVGTAMISSRALVLVLSADTLD